MSNRFIRTGTVLLAMAAMGMLLATAQAAAPVVKTVPWVATNPLIPHSTYTGKTITLKGTADVQGANIAYTWDFGDGTPAINGTVGNRYVIEARHAYSGAAGTVLAARLTVRDTRTNEETSKGYYILMQDRTLDVEANVAIDEGLWALHKAQTRTGDGGGNWSTWSAWYGVQATNVNAFEVNGHLEGGSPDNPYTETVQRGMHTLFTYLANWVSGSPANQTNPLGTFNADVNGNGQMAYVNQSRPFYQGGMFMDAIVASGTPNAVATSGPAGIVGKTYKTILQDMADYYLYCQYDSAPAGGGWRYNCGDWPDNSAAQWAAIGLIPVDRDRTLDPAKQWGISVPQIVKDWNRTWLVYSQHPAGYFGYTDMNPVWGPYATTASGLVQMALDGIGRDTAAHPSLPDPSWNKAETYVRDTFANGGGYTTNIKAYYYALFSFTKSMLLHDSNGDGIAEPITTLRSATPGMIPIDWYAADSAKGDPTNGVARTLINDQHTDGYWWYHDPDSSMYAFETAWAIIMLNRTVFASGVPVAVAQAVPNPGVVGQAITLDGSGSFHQDAAKAIDSWQWDFDGDGVWDASGPQVSRSFGALGNYVVRLRVTDNAAPEESAEATVTVQITTPPIAPTANAGGPYSFCPNRTPWFLDATGSVNPDQGQAEFGRPGDTIQEYAWDLDISGQFNDALGAAPDVTAYFTAKGVGAYLIALRVTDTTSLSFPNSGMPDLLDTDTSQVFIRAASDPACVCVSNLAARPKSGKVQLVWTHIAGTDHYNVYRGVTAGGPYIKLGATTSTYSTYLDTSVANGTTYYYVVRRAALNGDELCQSNEARATPTLLR